MTATEKNKPVEKVSVGQVKLAIFRNTSEDGETYYSTALEHQYKDKDGNWKDTSRYTQRELLHLAKAALMADSAIVKLKAADKKAAGEQIDEAEQEAA